ncbi:MAG: sulfotransferase family protein [Rhodobacteraceae bacterium]|nr:sulfotransferase family protein [Paracoccaceae bacterium]MAY45753.1 sulfotransferase family protein [Paracoccaceae bacterium]
MRIAMWSGPRNLSTAMMYAFGARSDCAVVDEPFYAAYLAKTGIDHPMGREIMESQPTDAALVAQAMTGPIPGGKAHWYQKHMTHHMIDGVPRDWMAEVVNVFLIRHPARVIASYARKREAPVLDDIGFRQQAELFNQVKALGQTPVVIDSADIRADPQAALSGLCTAIGLDWDPAMLHWPAGGHPDDGVWAAHWYGAVHRSTGFDGAEGDLPELSGAYADLSDQAMPFYERMAAGA